MTIEIDPYAGFCFGVEKAVQKAELELNDSGNLFCFGEIVHNQEEIDRLEKLGLKTIESSEFEKLDNKKVLIRAHGEPPETYETAKSKNIRLIEATCPIVLKLQQRVGKAWQEMKDERGSVIIAGKKNHPEIISLLGQTENKAQLIEKLEDVTDIDISRPITLFTQTTLSTNLYHKIVEEFIRRYDSEGISLNNFKHYNTICGQVSNRFPKLNEFCKNHDVIVFVSGKNSSNGKALFEYCKSLNQSTYFISSPEELDLLWFEKAKSVGISGATSTPQWLMEQVAQRIDTI